MIGMTRVGVSSVMMETRTRRRLCRSTMRACAGEPSVVWRPAAQLVEKR